MSSTENSAPLQPCPGCGRGVETAGLDPFSRVNCPQCGLELRVERAFENYRILEPLGTGGMGSVYKARDLRLNRLVALKVLRTEFAGDESLTAWLREEARITALVDHRHVVDVFSVGQDHGQFYVVMELVDGGSLDDQIEDEKRISESRALQVGLQVALGLQAALRAGLIHRDIKPANILLADAYTAKIVDFGLALLAAQHAEVEGEIWGTPYYVAPERLTGEPEDFRSDIYSLGATLFHAVAGRPIFEEETQSAAELKKLKSNPVTLKEVAPDVSEETARVIDQMLRPDPADRPGSYSELIAQLQTAYSAAVVRDEQSYRHGIRPKRFLVSLGVILLSAAAAAGIIFGFDYLAGKTKQLFPSAAAVQAQIETGRRQLAEGHYAAAAERFREIARHQPNVQPMAELCGALELWEQGRFTQALPGLEQFVRQTGVTRSSPSPGSRAGNVSPAWINDYKPLAQDRLDDYRLYSNWQEITRTVIHPEGALAQLGEILGKLKTKGALAVRIADEKAKLSEQVTKLASERAAEEKSLGVKEKPRWDEALAKARSAIAAYRFRTAVTVLENLTFSAGALQAERDNTLQRARWLAEWKTTLMADLNETGYDGEVRDIHGVRYEGPVRRATPNNLQLRTGSRAAMIDWPDLSPKMLLKMSTAFIRPGVRDTAERQWRCAIFAWETNQTDAANTLAAKAGELEPEFRDLRARFFLPGKK